MYLQHKADSKFPVFIAAGACDLAVHCWAEGGDLPARSRQLGLLRRPGPAAGLNPASLLSTTPLQVERDSTLEVSLAAAWAGEQLTVLLLPV